MQIDPAFHGQEAARDGRNLATVVKTMQTPAFHVLEEVYSELFKLYLSRNVDHFKKHFYSNLS